MATDQVHPANAGLAPGSKARLLTPSHAPAVLGPKGQTRGTEGSACCSEGVGNLPGQPRQTRETISEQDNCQASSIIS